MWVIMQTGYRKNDGSTLGYGTSPVGPTRKLVAVFRNEMAVDRWLDRLDKWATESAKPDDQNTLIPTYEVMSVDRLVDLDPGQCVGKQFFSDHGQAASLRRMVRNVRESHATLRREMRRRG